MLPFKIMDFSLAFNSLSFSGTDEWHTETEQNATGDEDHCDLNVRLFPCEINSQYHMDCILWICSTFRSCFTSHFALLFGSLV